MLTETQGGVRLVYDMIRDGAPNLSVAETSRPITASEHAVGIFRRLQRRHIIPQEREAMFVLALDAGLRPVGAHVPHVGTADGCMVHPRDVFRMPIALGATGVIVAHNHPSGDTKPSQQDAAVTARLRSGAKLLELTLHDSIVVTDRNHLSIIDIDPMRMY